jgi:predicted ATPase
MMACTASRTSPRASLLGSLVDKSLLVAESAGPSVQCRLLETIRHFGADRLAEAGEDQAAVAAAHCAHYLAWPELQPRT